MFEKTIPEILHILECGLVRVDAACHSYRILRHNKTYSKKAVSDFRYQIREAKEVLKHLENEIERMEKEAEEIYSDNVATID